jgi:lipoate-protein ligase A
MDQGRLLIDPPSPGPWNMGVDEVLWEDAEQGELSIRFYSWTPATLSLGYFQPIEQRRGHAASAQCPVVRRASGGGAIVHDDDSRELTYSVAFPAAGRARHVQQWLYDVMHSSLIEALSTWRILAQLCPTTEGLGGVQPFLCFERHSAGDVLIEGHKVAGSAQRRSARALLQHGSVLLSRSPAAPELPGISQLSGVTLGWDQIRRAWLESLQRIWPAHWQMVSLTAAQRERVSDKVAAKFAHTRWNQRR